MKKLSLILIFNFIFVISSCNVIKTISQKNSVVEDSFFQDQLNAFEVFETATQEQEKIITLTYSAQNEVVSCSVTNTTNSYVSTPCSCTLGVCQVGITGNIGFYGMAYADYTIADDSSSTSNSKINLNIDFICQANWTRVPANSSLGVHSDFCVMTYEAKRDAASGDAISSPNNSPWTSISANQAKNKCNLLGTNYDLISNPEWLTIAQNAEGVGSNWTGGSVGSGCLFLGNVGGSLAGCSNSGYNGPNPDYGTSRSDNGSASLSLSNGEVIWDLSGNVQEWIDWIPGGSVDSAPQPCMGNGFHEFYNISCAVLATADYAPSNPAGIATSYGSSYGLGSIYETASPAQGARRGGNFSSVISGGIFSLILGFSNDYASTDSGFRCVWRP